MQVISSLNHHRDADIFKKPGKNLALAAKEAGGYIQF
jgi:hypothetical protein